MNPTPPSPMGFPIHYYRKIGRPPPKAGRHHQADVGLAWDGDFDRCFFFDEHGGFIEGYFIVGFWPRAY